MKTACFTGHRPDKLEGGYDYYSEKNLELGRKIRDVCINLIEKHNVRTFICGGALGVDQLSFMVCHKLKERYPHIRVVLAKPFEYQDANWFDVKSKELLKKHEKQADITLCVDTVVGYQLNNIKEKIYHPAKMQKRNEYMVDNSQFLVAVHNGDEEGGTANCIKYAKSKGNEIKIIEISVPKIESKKPTKK